MIFSHKPNVLTMMATFCVVGVVPWSAGFAQDGNRLAERFRQVDTNNDGKVTASELPQAELFRQLDRNGDGAITLAETRVAVAAGLLNSQNAPKPVAREVEKAGNENSNIRQGPKPLKAGAFGVGKQIPDLSFTDIAGGTHKLSDYQQRSAIVIALTGTGCPLCLKYAPSLAAIEEKYRDRGVAFIFVNPNESEKVQRLQQAVTAHGFKGPYVRDGKKAIPRALGAETTTEVFVLDKARTLVYRGAVDDQYGFAYALDAPRFSYLSNALERVLAGEKPAVAATSSPGCELFYDETNEPLTRTSITYHNRVSRILQANCIECHRTSGIAPIALESYKEVKDYAGMIRNVVKRGIMPPWFAAPHQTPRDTDDDSAPQPLHWANNRSLSSSEKADLYAWVKAGAPEGNSKDAPLSKTFPDGWLIGEPDAVFEFEHPVSVKATGTMPYKYVTVETDLSEDKWIQAIEVRPGKIGVVHHVIVSLRDGERQINERDGFWGVYVPGNSKLVYPEGYAKLLPKGAKLRFQMHYTPNGTATEDSTRIGLVYAKKPPKHEVKVAGIVNSRISIPPGAENHQEVASLRLPYDVKVLSFLPHMHLRGKAARYEVLTADGTEMLLDIPRYDFNWQLLYRLAEPRTIKQGDTIRFTAWFDNSDKNPANPDPTKTVKWGPQTEDEMHLGYVEYIVPGAKPGEPLAGMRRARATGAVRKVLDNGLFKRLDVNGDGSITRAEVRQRLPGNKTAAGPTFDRLDVDRNGKLDKTEFAKLQSLRRQ